MKLSALIFLLLSLSYSPSLSQATPQKNGKSLLLLDIEELMLVEVTSVSSKSLKIPDTSAVLLSQASPDRSRQPLIGLSIEDLMDIEVTSVSKKAQKLSDAPAAVYVITQEDIRRSGVTSIPDALRLAPGVNVARQSANTWAVSARGFNELFAHKLLVLVDGRTIYSPLFSGVEWNYQDTLLEDIDRIEVIRGPGASLWGANAMNGVINIITRRARDTQGGLMYGGGGTEEKGFGGIRYGSRLGDDVNYRVFAKYFDRAGSLDASSGHDAGDSTHVTRGGFRMDSELSSRDSLNAMGEIFTGAITNLATVLGANVLEPAPEDTGLSGGHLLLNWKHAFSLSSETKLQLYYDRLKQNVTFPEKIDTYDVDFQHRFALGKRHDIIWGAGYRYSRFNTIGFFTFTLDPANSATHLFSSFIQDDITLREDKLHLIAGTRLERNDFTGYEVQPNVRLLWTPDHKNTLWFAVSRAVQTPGPSEFGDGRLNAVDTRTTPPLVIRAIANREQKAETLVAFDLGYRVKPGEGVFLDVATFYNVYRRLRALEIGAPFPEATPPPTHLVVPLSLNNRMKGNTYGGEIDAQWSVTDWWRVEGIYSVLVMQLQPDPSLAYQGNESIEGNSPRRQAALRSSLDIGRAVETDLWLRYVDELPTLSIDRYYTLDARLAWRPRNNLEFSLVGQNLLNDHHKENSIRLLVERSVYGKAAWRF